MISFFLRIELREFVALIEYVQHKKKFLASASYSQNDRGVSDEL